MGIALKAAAELQAAGQETGAILRTLESVRRQPAAYLGDATPALNTLAQALSESADRIAEQMGAVAVHPIQVIARAYGFAEEDVSG